MTGDGSVMGWKLDRQCRTELLDRFPPTYPRVIADHVTLAVDGSGDPLPAGADACIVGRADDGAGVEAMVVALDGTTDRPDGSTFHITWSLAPGRRAVESNDAIRDKGWTDVDPPVRVAISPARF